MRGTTGKKYRFAFSAFPHLYGRLYDAVIRGLRTAYPAECKAMILFVWVFLVLNSHLLSNRLA